MDRWSIVNDRLFLLLHGWGDMLGLRSGAVFGFVASQMVLSACGSMEDDASNGEAASDSSLLDPSIEITPYNAAEVLARQWCELEQECGCEDSEDIEKCVEDYHLLVGNSYFDLLKDSDVVEFNEDCVRQRLHRNETMGCRRLDDLIQEGRFTCEATADCPYFSGTLTEDEPCTEYGVREVCERGLICDFGNTGTCVPKCKRSHLPDRGMSCDGDCRNSGQDYCTIDEPRTCVARKLDGSSCDESVECSSGRCRDGICTESELGICAGGAPSGGY